MPGLRHHRLPLALRVFVTVLLALGMVLQPVMASMAEAHELAHDPTGGHAHVERADALADELAVDEDEGAAVTLHMLLDFAHCCGQSTSLISALQVMNLVPAAERPLLDRQPLPLHPRTFTPYRPPIA